MVCKVCGRSIPDENAHFCENCGASLRDIDIQGSANGQQTQTPPSYQPPNYTPKKDEPVSFGNWIGSMLLPFIPIVGSLVYLVMLIIWSCSSEINESKRNWARASLVISLVSTVLMIVLVIVFVANIVSDPVFMDYMNSSTLY